MRINPIHPKNVLNLGLNIQFRSICVRLILIHSDWKFTSNSFGLISIGSDTDIGMNRNSSDWLGMNFYTKLSNRNSFRANQKYSKSFWYLYSSQCESIRPIRKTFWISDWIFGLDKSVSVLILIHSDWKFTSNSFGLISIGSDTDIRMNRNSFDWLGMNFYTKLSNRNSFQANQKYSESFWYLYSSQCESIRSIRKTFWISDWIFSLDQSVSDWFWFIPIENLLRIRSDWFPLARIQISEWIGIALIGWEWISIGNFRIGIHFEPIRTIPNHSDICIRANANQSDPSEKRFESRIEYSV